MVSKSLGLQIPHFLPTVRSESYLLKPWPELTPQAVQKKKDHKLDS